MTNYPVKYYMIYLVKMFIICSEFSAESMQGYDTSLIYLNWIQVYQLAIDISLIYYLRKIKLQQLCYFIFFIKFVIFISIFFFLIQYILLHF
jgi:hypothetical protein